MSTKNDKCEKLQRAFADFLEEIKEELFFEANRKAEIYDFEFDTEKPSEKPKRFIWEKLN